MTGKTPRAKRGISIRRICTEHEAYVLRQLESGSDPDAVMKLHATKIAWLQHERLVHLIVTLIFTVLFLFSIWLFLSVTGSLTLALVALVLIVLAVYIHHYFYLENTVQAWYTLYDRLYHQLY